MTLNNIAEALTEAKQLNKDGVGIEISHFAGTLPLIHPKNTNYEEINEGLKVAQILTWVGLGSDMKAFFAGESSPLHKLGNSKVIKVLKRYIQKRTTRCVLQALVFQQAEPFLHQPFIDAGFQGELPSWDAMFKAWLLEEFRTELSVLSAKYHEYRSASNIKDCLSEIEKFFVVELSEDEVNEFSKFIHLQTNKVYSTAETKSDYQQFCIGIFYKYQKEIPAYRFFCQARIDEKQPIPGQKKAITRYGQFSEYPTRGKDKVPRKRKKKPKPRKTMREKFGMGSSKKTKKGKTRSL